MYETKNRLRTKLLLGAATAAAMSLVGAAYAAEGDVETVVVTGSRIPQVNLVSASPVTMVGQEDIKLQGTTSVETMLNNLPSVFAGQTSEMSNGSTGTATVNLRGLGAERTLVLVDGKRLMPGSPDAEVADLNFIPTTLVERVEVFTGGASTVYGSDAVAGVVNFIMRKDFEGIQFDVQGGISNHTNGMKWMHNIVNDAGYALPKNNVWDGENTSLNVTFGANTADGKGNVTAYFGYRTQRAVKESQRDFSACATTVNYYTSPQMNSYYCGGSGTIPAGRFRTYTRASTMYGTTNAADLAIAGQYYTNTGRTVTSTTSPYYGETIYSLNQYKVSGSGTSLFSGADAWNYAPYNYIQRPDSRYLGGAFAHYDYNKYFNFTGSFMFMDDHTIAQIAPSGIFYGTTYATNCDNPYLAQNSDLQGYLCGAGTGLAATDDASLTIGRRFVESGGRQDDLRHTDYRMVLGMHGEIVDGITYEASFQYATAIYAENYMHDMSTKRLNNALKAVDDGSGNTVCKSVLDGTDPSCVAIDVFNTGGLTDDMLAYVEGNGYKQGSTEETVLNVNFTADLGVWGVKSPWASSGAFVNVGYEYRSEDLVYKTDEVFQSGDLTGQGGETPSVSGGYNVSELFLEGDLPVLSNLPGAEQLTLKVGYRYASYNLQGTASSYKYGFDWQTTEDIKVRGSYARAVRAPNVNELFYPTYLNLWDGSDPCSGIAPLYTLEQCQRTGVTTTQYGGIDECSSSQCGGVYGGNLALKPESADTWSIGTVFTPSFIPGFNASVDYYYIKVKDRISTVPESIIIDQCALNDNAYYCGLIHRNPLTGALFGQGNDAGYVQATNINTGYLKSEGIDTAINYMFDLDQVGLTNAGTLSLSMVGTLQYSYEEQPYTGGDTYDCAGYFGLVCGSPNPKWRHNFRANWETPWDVLVSVTWRHFGPVKFDGNDKNHSLNSGYAYDIADAYIPAFNYIDLGVEWNALKGLTLRFGVENLFDKDPPVVDSGNLGISGPGSYGNGNTYPGVYDSLGRTMFLSATVKL